jgi:signal transduction histidine kinase
VTPGDSFLRVSEPRSVVRVALTRFLLLSFGTLVVVGAGTFVVSDHIARQEAIRDQQMRAEELDGPIAKALKKADSGSGPEARRDLYRAMDTMVNGLMRPTALWDAQERLVWAAGGDFEAGALYDFPAELEAVARKRESKVMEAGDEVPEPVGAEDDSPHPVLGENAHRLEVYVGARRAGMRFMYEAHAQFPSVDDEAEEIFKELLPLTLGALLLLQLANVPLALSLARRVDQAAEHRSKILKRSLMSWHDERRRLAQDLHDGVIQDLSAMSYALPAVLAQLPDEPEADPARSIGERMNEALTQDLRALRSVLIDLVPADLDGHGLHAALETLAQRSADRGLQVDLSVEPDLGVGSTVAGLVYRVVREGLRNAEKHAEARTASVHVARQGDHVEILICDDGRGIQDREAAEGHVGLRLLDQMLADVGGSVHLSSEAGQGARLRGVIPAVLPDLDDESR